MVLNKEILKINLVNQIYSLLKEKLINGEMKNGQKFDIKALCQEFNVSQTPIREAVHRLIKDGFIINVPRRGYYLTKLKKRDLEEIYELRQLIEYYSLKYAIQNIKESKLKELLIEARCFKSGVSGVKSFNKKREKFYNLDKKLHIMIVQSCPNRRLNEIYLQIFGIINMIMNIGNTKNEYDKYLYDYINLIEVMLKKDLSKAREIIKIHINNSLNRLIPLFERKEV